MINAIIADIELYIFHAPSTQDTKGCIVVGLGGDLGHKSDMGNLAIGSYYYHGAGKESGQGAIGHLEAIVGAEGAVSTEVGEHHDIGYALGSAEAALGKGEVA